MTEVAKMIEPAYSSAHPRKRTKPPSMAQPCPAQMSGAQTIEAVRAECPETLLAFSTGKDAIAAWLAIRDHFDRVEPYYLYLIPGLEFVEESLSYYERFFGARIARLPHPGLHRMLNGLVFQPPERCLPIEQAALPMHEYTHIRQAMIQMRGLPDEVMVADGVRAADSPLRRIAIQKTGPINRRLRKYHPVWDWKKADLVEAFRRSGVKLPIDYRLFGRTFDGVDLRFLLPLKRHRPADYKRVLDWFPLAELEVFRWEAANG